MIKHITTAELSIKLLGVLALFFIITIFITGCEPVKKRIATIIDLKKIYCYGTSNSITKQLAINEIRRSNPDYPIKGICTSLGGTNE